MPEQAKAYVLIEADAGRVEAVLATLRGITGITTAEPVTGPYDIVVVVELDEQRAIGRLVMHDIHAVPGIKRTITCFAI